MRIERAAARDVGALADAWVALAAEQRAHGSHLEAAANHGRIRESMAHHVVQDTCLIARPDRENDRANAANASIAASAEAGTPASDPVDEARAGLENGSREDFLGFVTFSVESDGYEMDAKRGLVENIFVEPDARGDGVGAALLEAAEDDLVDRGVDVVSLEVLAANDRAREFYAREGYRDHRVVVEKRVDVETDTKDTRRD